jgi:predicted mannosyl-3-phosphoglycerate phosphatase (HAD superfamily)
VGGYSDRMHAQPRSDPRAARYVAPSVSASIVVFTVIDGALREPPAGSCHDARAAINLLMMRDIPIVLLSHGDGRAVQLLQRELGIVQPFVCGGGAALHIPRGYFEELDGLTAGDDEWEIFEFGVRDPARAVRLLSSLYSVRGEDVLTIGFGCGWEDAALLEAVHVPVIVRAGAIDQSRLLRRLPGAYLTTATGPAGWSEVILGSAGV